jgi:hypothetical protein
MKNFTKIAGLITSSVAAYAGFLAWRAHTDLVTLHVRDASIASVVASLRWQTWERFIANTNVTGTITLDVDKMPLEGVLGILGEQLNGRWSTVYPIYRGKASLVSLQRALRGELSMAETHFTNYHAQGPAFRGEFGAGRAQPVTLHLADTDLSISAMALERFGGGQILIEKGNAPKINLELTDAEFAQAVRAVARTANRSSTRLYALEPMRNPARIDMARGEPRGPRGERPPLDPETETARLERMQQVLQTLPEEQRTQAEERQLERIALQSLPAEQRQQVIAERMNSPEMQVRAEQRSVSGIKNSTPDQRRDRYERMYQMRKARAARS